MRVAVTGASGLLGRHLCAALRSRGDEVVEASLRDPQAAAERAAPCEAVINLSGEPIAQRWNDRVKSQIRASRTIAPRQFLDAIARSSTRPRVYVSASAIGYYGTSDDRTFTEDDGPGDDFLARVCQEWEAVAQTAAELGMRTCCVRAGLVLARDGGVLEKLLPVFKAGGGGRVGSGKQWYSWVHLDDAVALYLLALDRLAGAINAAAPNPVRNEEFVTTLARMLNRPAAVPAPAFMLKLMLGDGASMVLEGQRVLPQRALAEGYEFKFPALDAALADLLG